MSIYEEGERKKMEAPQPHVRRLNVFSLIIVGAFALWFTEIQSICVTAIWFCGRWYWELLHQHPAAVVHMILQCVVLHTFRDARHIHLSLMNMRELKKMNRAESLLCGIRYFSNLFLPMYTGIILCSRITGRLEVRRHV